MNVLVFTNLYPNKLNPNFGIFIRNRVCALNEFPGVNVKVVAPVPWFPPINISEKWYRFSQIPKRETIDGIEVYHPRYLVTPKVGMSFYGKWMELGVRSQLKAIRKTFPFDLIDAHFLYPDGFAAVALAKYFNCPVCLTARGSDVTSYLQLPQVKGIIQSALKEADRTIAVSRSLAEIMTANGAVKENIRVVPNGIDPERFFQTEISEARTKLNLPMDKKIILTVCSLVELKGVHLLIEALSLLESSLGKDSLLCVVGQGPEMESLQALAEKLSLGDRVCFIGSVQNENLVDWYNAADLFFLGSSREGWPNVVCEAQACGTPVVATKVNGIPEIISSADLGMLVARTPQAFAVGIDSALEKNWDRELIARQGRQRTWQNVASEVHQLFIEMLKDEEN